MTARHTPALLLGCDPDADEHFGHLPHVEVITYDGLKSLQRAVGGLVEPVSLYHPRTGAEAVLWLNEEAKLDLATSWLNYAAMALLRANEVARETPILLPGDYLAGPAVLTGFDPETGEVAPLTAEWLEDLPSWFFESPSARQNFIDQTTEAIECER